MDSKELLKKIKKLKVDNERITRNHLDLQRQMRRLLWKMDRIRVLVQ